MAWPLKILSLRGGRAELVTVVLRKSPCCVGVLFVCEGEEKERAQARVAVARRAAIRTRDGQREASAAYFRDKRT